MFFISKDSIFSSTIISYDTQMLSYDNRQKYYKPCKRKKFRAVWQYLHRLACVIGPTISKNNIYCLYLCYLFVWNIRWSLTSSQLLNRIIIVILYKKFKITKMNLICTYELLQKGACCLTKEYIEEILNIFLYGIFLSTVPRYFVNYSRKLSLCWQCWLGERCGT